MCQAYSKIYIGCGKANHFEWLFRSITRRVTRDAVTVKYTKVHGMCLDHIKLIKNESNHQKECNHGML